MPNVAVLTNDLQYEFTYKITHSTQELEQKLTAFNQFLDGIRNQNQAVIHLQLINDPADPAVQRRYKNRDAGIPALAGRPENRIIDSICAPSDLIVVKGRDSGFFTRWRNKDVSAGHCGGGCAEGACFRKEAERNHSCQE